MCTHEVAKMTSTSVTPPPMAGENPWWKKVDKSTPDMHETSKKNKYKSTQHMHETITKTNKTSKQKKKLLVDDCRRPMTTRWSFPN